MKRQRKAVAADRVTVCAAETLDETQRGTGGFGSTGV